MAEAAAEYQNATAKTNFLSWQQAMAFNRLGRIHAAQGQTGKALAHYEQALDRDQNIAEAYTNKGHLLEKLGKHAEALELYRQALSKQPNDPLAAVLVREAERRTKLARDQEKRQRIDQLVSELVKAHEQGKTRVDNGDGWTSTPLTLAILPMQYQGQPSTRAGEDEWLMLSLEQALQNEGRITLVERELLDQLLEELKLSASELVNPRVAARLGKILAARLMVSSRLVRFGTSAQLSLRLIETETSRIRASAIGEITGPNDMHHVFDTLSQTLLAKMPQDYPLQARIATLIPPKGVVLNIGAEEGLTPGLIMQVFDPEKMLKIDGQVIGAHRDAAGLVKVQKVDGNLAQAHVLQQSQPFQPGWKTQEVHAP